jgi:hypothetical protein
MSCNTDTLIQLAKNQLKKLTSKTELTENNYNEYKEARGKPLDEIEKCHKIKMKELGDKPEEHDSDANDSLHTFEKKMAQGLKAELGETYNKDQIKGKEKIFDDLLKVQYELNKQIEDYEKKTNKINDNMKSNDLLLDSQTTKTDLLENVNIGVLVFVILSLIYINFKSFFTRKSKMLSNKKGSKLFNLKDDKKQYENINNENKMMRQRELLQRN